MLKRIFIAVGIFVIGFALVVSIVISQIRDLSHTVAGMGEEAIPLVRAAVELSDQTRILEGAIDDLFLQTDDEDRNEAKESAENARVKLKTGISTIMGPRFANIHQDILPVPQRKTSGLGSPVKGSAGGGGVSARSVTLGSFLQQLAIEVEALIEESGTAEKHSEKHFSAESELSAVRGSLGRSFLDGVDLKEINTEAHKSLALSVTTLLYTKSKDDAESVGMAKLSEALSLFGELDLESPQRIKLESVKAGLFKVRDLLAEVASGGENYQRFSRRASEVRFHIELLRRYADNRFNTGYAGLGGQTSRITVFTITLSLFSVIIGGLMAVRMARKISLPLARAAELVDRVAKHDLTTHFAVSTNDETGRIARALNVMVEDLRKDVRILSGDSSSLREASTGLDRISRQLTANADETCKQAAVVSSSANSVSHDLESVAAAIEEMSSSMGEIARNAGEASRVANRASESARQTNSMVEKLGDSSARISTVIQTITSIAAQTNLLALNAAIEAARAGDAGKGFTVVANEVKQLAQQTSRATEEIGESIAEIQSDAQTAVAAIREIAEIIRQIDILQSSIAGAVHQQNSATFEISKSLSTATEASRDISARMVSVVDAANEASSEAKQTANAAEQLVRISAGLRRVVEQFTLPKNSIS